MRIYFSKLLREITGFLVSPTENKMVKEFNWLEKPILQLFQTIESLRAKLLDKEKTELLAKGIRQVSHDLGAPISGLNVLVDKLKQEGSKFVPFSESVLLRLENLAEDLRDRSRINIENIENFEIYSALSDALNVIKEQDGGAVFEVSAVEGRSVSVYGNKRHFIRMIECLVQNSLEAAIPSRKLVVRILIQESDIFVNIKIEDNGKGISKGNLNLVTLSGISIGKEGNERSGTGLGLSFAFERTEEWGGNAKIISDMGKGTVVELNFLKVSNGKL